MRTAFHRLAFAFVAAMIAGACLAVPVWAHGVGPAGVLMRQLDHAPAKRCSGRCVVARISDVRRKLQPGLVPHDKPLRFMHQPGAGLTGRFGMPGHAVPALRHASGGRGLLNLLCRLLT